MLFYAIETLSISYVVNGNTGLRISIIRLSDRFEPLLASCVPNLQLHHFLVDFKSLDFKVDAYRALIVVYKVIFGKALKKASFTRTQVSDQN